VKRLLFLLFLFAYPLAAQQVPTLITHNDQSLTWLWQGSVSTNIQDYEMATEPATASGDAAIVNMEIASSSGAEPSGMNIADNSSNTFALVNSQTDATNGNWLGQFCGIQTSGASLFTANGTTDLGFSWVKGTVTQYNNLTCTVDQTWGIDQTTASATITFGAAKATSVANDVIHLFAFMTTTGVTMPTTESSFTPGSGMQLVDGSGQMWDMSPQEWGVFAIGSYNPSLTWPNAAQYVAGAVALKASSSPAGSPVPTTPYIRAIQNVGVYQYVNTSAAAGGPQNQTSPIKIQFPTSANSVIALLWTGLGGTSGDAANWTVGSTTVCTSSVAGETMKIASLTTGSATLASGASAVAYILNAGPSQSRVISCTMANSTVQYNTFDYYELANAGAFDTSSGTCPSCTGSQTTAGAAITFNIGPFAQANEIAIATLGVDNSGVLAQAPSGVINYEVGNFNWNNSGSYTNQCNSTLVTAPQPVNECNGFFVAFPTSTSAVTVTANPVTNGTNTFNNYSYAWAAFLPATQAEFGPPFWFQLRTSGPSLAISILLGILIGVGYHLRYKHEPPGFWINRGYSSRSLGGNQPGAAQPALGPPTLEAYRTPEGIYRAPVPAKKHGTDS
jgi:hypothetical protein